MVLLSLRQIAPNQTLVCTEKATILFSYRVPVAAYLPSERRCIRTEKRYSVTTSKHINKWLATYSHLLVDTVPQAEIDALLR